MMVPVDGDEKGESDDDREKREGQTSDAEESWVVMSAGGESPSAASLASWEVVAVTAAAEATAETTEANASEGEDGDWATFGLQYCTAPEHEEPDDPEFNEYDARKLRFREDASRLCGRTGRMFDRRAFSTTRWWSNANTVGVVASSEFDSRALASVRGDGGALQFRTRVSVLEAAGLNLQGGLNRARRWDAADVLRQVAVSEVHASQRSLFKAHKYRHVVAFDVPVAGHVVTTVLTSSSASNALSNPNSKKKLEVTDVDFYHQRAAMRRDIKAAWRKYKQDTFYTFTRTVSTTTSPTWTAFQQPAHELVAPLKLPTNAATGAATTAAGDAQTKLLRCWLSSHFGKSAVADPRTRLPSSPTTWDVAESTRADLRSVARYGSRSTSTRSLPSPYTVIGHAYECWAARAASASGEDAELPPDFDDWWLEMDFGAPVRVDGITTYGRAPLLRAFPDESYFAPHGAVAAATPTNPFAPTHAMLKAAKECALQGPLFPVIEPGSDQQWVSRFELLARNESSRTWWSVGVFPGNVDAVSPNVVRLGALLGDDVKVRYLRIRPLSAKDGGFHGHAPAMRVSAWVDVISQPRGRDGGGDEPDSDEALAPRGAVMLSPVSRSGDIMLGGENDGVDGSTVRYLVTSADAELVPPQARRVQGPVARSFAYTMRWSRRYDKHDLHARFHKKRQWELDLKFLHGFEDEDFGYDGDEYDGERGAWYN